jgi:gamma-glutamyltranspeptidase/glutathione hydrolase
MALNILSQVPPEKLSQEGPCRTAWIVQALKVAHRHRLMRPIQDLIHYDDQVQNKLSMSRAEKIAASLRDEGTGETTHFSIVDKDGMAVGVTQSLNSYFGSKIAHPDLGFFYNSYMIEFVSPLRNNPFALRPNAMPYSSMSASILARESGPLMVVGSPANDRIISAVVQVISNWLDLKKTIQTAIEKPRLHTIREEEVMMEVRPSSATLLALEELGFSVHAPFTSLFAGKLNPYFGGVHTIAFEENGWTGAADPRRDGAVVYAD